MIPLEALVTHLYIILIAAAVSVAFGATWGLIPLGIGLGIHWVVIALDF